MRLRQTPPPEKGPRAPGQGSMGTTTSNTGGTEPKAAAARVRARGAFRRRLLTVSERSGLRFSLRNRKATTGRMQTTVVSAMVSHTAGWARVFCAFPEKAEESEALGAPRCTAPRFYSWRPHSPTLTT